MKLLFYIISLTLIFISCKFNKKVQPLDEFICSRDSTVYKVIQKNSIGFNEKTSKIYPYYYYVFYKDNRFYELIKPENKLIRINDSLVDIVPYNVWKILSDSIIQLNIAKYKLISIDANRINLVLLNNNSNLDTLIIEKQND